MQNILGQCWATANQCVFTTANTHTHLQTNYSAMSIDGTRLKNITLCALQKLLYSFAWSTVDMALKMLSFWTQKNLAPPSFQLEASMLSKMPRPSAASFESQFLTCCISLMLVFRVCYLTHPHNTTLPHVLIYCVSTETQVIVFVLKHERWTECFDIISVVSECIECTGVNLGGTLGDMGTVPR